MMRFLSVVAVFAVFLAALPGCGSSPRQWEITVENKSDVPCSFFVVASAPNSDGKANVEDVAKGKAITLLVGSVPTVIQSVKVVRGQDVQTLIPKVDLPVGKRYTIKLTADGKLETAVSDL